MFKKLNIVSLFTELIVIPVVLIAIYVWGDALAWDFSNVGALELFPLLGLLAYSIMWWHFLADFMIRYVSGVEHIKKWHRFSSDLVLVLIVLHPLLLNVNMFQNGLTSFDYVAPDQRFYLVLGVVSLFGFLLFDLWRKMKQRDWFKRNSKTIFAISDVSFILVFIHSINLGQHLANGWFKTYWIILGISSFVFISAKHYAKFTKRSSPK